MKTIITMILLLSGVGARAQWQKVNVPTTASLRGLSVVRQNVVWASGTDGTVIRTVDGGKTWSLMRVAGAESLDFRGIKAFDEKTAVIISSGPAEKGQAKIYRTTDGGRNWTQVYEDNRAGIFFDAIAFWDHKHGIVLSDPIDGKFALFTTEDGGLTWKQLSPSPPSALANEGAFAASNSCLTVEGARNVWFATGGANVARVFRSRDRGLTWDVSETPMHPTNASSGIFSIAFAGADDGVAVGGDYAHPAASNLPNLLQTHDGGKTWQTAEPTNPVGLYLSSVTLVRSDVVVAAGTSGGFVLLAGWRKDSDQNINAVTSVGRQGIWAVGPNGAVLKMDWIVDLRRRN